MKANIHPQFYNNATVTCACGNSFITGSTVQQIHTEICSACHPFYTGKQTLLDTLGRVDQFRKRQTAGLSSVKKAPKSKTTTNLTSRLHIKAAIKGNKAVKEKRVLSKKEEKTEAKKKK